MVTTIDFEQKMGTPSNSGSPTIDFSEPTTPSHLVHSYTHYPLLTQYLSYHLYWIIAFVYIIKKRLLKCIHAPLTYVYLITIGIRISGGDYY